MTTLGPTVVVMGLGEMGRLTTRMLIDKGAIIVGGIVRSPAQDGVDVGELAGIAPLGVHASTDPAGVLEQTRPDLVVMTMASYVDNTFDQTRMALEAGSNVISLAEEPLYSWHTSPTKTAAIDAIARAHGTSYTCTGHTDGYWVSLVATMMGTAHRVEAVRGHTSWNAESWGPEMARSRFVGQTVDELEHWLATTKRPPNFARNALHALAAAAGLTVKSSRTETRPILAEQPVRCAVLDRLVEPGLIIGLAEVDTVETLEGTALSHQMEGKIYIGGDRDTNRWDVIGDPCLDLVNERIPAHVTTCATLVNRIPDVLNADPGYLTVDQLPPLRYRPLPLHTYVNP